MRSEPEIPCLQAWGSVNVWWNSSSTHLSTGEVYDVTATVKGHDIYQGTAQTTVLRCKLVAAS